MRKTYVVSAKRSAIDNFLGSLTTVKPVDLGATVVKALLENGKVAPEQVDELLCGNVLSAGLGQNIGRQVALAAGILESVCLYPVNVVCGSELRTVVEGVMSTQTGFNDIVAAGDVESMSGTPYLIPANTCIGNKMRDFKCVDHMIYDTLTDAMSGIHMGATAENIAKKCSITREMQDAFGYASQQKAIAVVDSGHFKDKIVPVGVRLRKETIVFDTDEHPNRKFTPEKMVKLRPASVKDGSATATNASGISGGTSFILLASEEAVEKYNLTPLCEVVGISQGGVDPLTVGLGPTPAIRSALKYADMKLDEVELVELNETFAIQSLDVVHKLMEKHGIDREAFLKKANVNGGAIVLGHPVGASGDRILVTLIHGMIKRDTKSGPASLYVGGGQGTAVIVKCP